MNHVSYCSIPLIQSPVIQCLQSVLTEQSLRKKYLMLHYPNIKIKRIDFAYFKAVVHWFTQKGH